MRNLVALICVLNVGAGPARALEVDRDEVEAAAPRAAQLTKVERTYLVVRRAVAQALLLEMSKNEWALKFAGVDQPRGRMAIALGHSAASALVIAALGKVSHDEWRRARRPALDAEGEVRRQRLRELNESIHSTMTREWTEVERLDFELNKITRESMREFYQENLAAIEWLERPRAVGVPRRMARALSLVVVPSLVVAVAYDLRSVWLQVSLTPEELAQKRAELESMVRNADAALATNPAPRVEPVPTVKPL